MDSSKAALEKLQADLKNFQSLHHHDLTPDDFGSKVQVFLDEIQAILDSSES